MRKRLCFLLIMLMCSFTVFSATVYAQAEPEAETQPIETAVTAEPLTPDGNLTLVDDIQNLGGKQFITVTTKSGNYFYLVIDRDDDGDNTVHFLNLVDEEDLLKILEEEKAFVYQTPEVEEPEPEPVKIEEPKKETVNPYPAILLLAVIGIGIAVYFYMQAKKKEKVDMVRPHPDEEYEDDFGYEFFDADEAQKEELFQEDLEGEGS